MNPLTLFAPAKINLFLAITGKRPDGFHDLLSVVAPLAFGDELIVEPRAGEGVYSLECDEPAVPTDGTNLVLRAAHLFASTTGCQRSVHFKLIKRIPLAAGLGGGSSDGTTALLGLNQLNGSPLDFEGLASLATELGSDCGLFLHRAPCVMRGRGHEIQPLDPQAVGRIHGRRLLVFKPSFGISTAWAYRQLAAGATESYLPAATAERRVIEWLHAPNLPAEDLLMNSMERVAFDKFVALPTMLEHLRTQFHLAVGMSGSGSACYALLQDNTLVAPIISSIKAAWGESVFVIESRFG